MPVCRLVDVLLTADADGGAASGLTRCCSNARGVMSPDAAVSLNASDRAVLVLRCEPADCGRWAEPVDTGRWEIMSCDAALPESAAAAELLVTLLVALAARESGPTDADLLLGRVPRLWPAARLSLDGEVCLLPGADVVPRSEAWCAGGGRWDRELDRWRREWLRCELLPSREACLEE